MNTQVVFLPRSPGEPPWSTVLDEDGAILSRGAFDRAQAQARAVLVIPGADALARWIELPGQTDAQARSAAGYLLESDLASTREATHIAVGPATNGRRLVVAVDRAAMTEWLARAAALGLKPDVVAPDHLLLDPPGEGEALGARIGDMIAVRAEGLAVTAEQDLAPLLVGERALRLVEAPEAVEALLARNALTPPINLLQGEFAAKSDRGGAPAALGPTLALLAAALAAPLLLEGARLVRFEAAAAAAEARAEAGARAAAPANDADAAQNALEWARSRLSRIDAEAGGGFLRPAATVFAAVEQSPGMQIERLNYSADGGLQVALAYADFSQLEALKASLARAGLTAEEGETSTSAGRVATQLTIRSGR